TYLGRVAKARIVAGVREARGEDAGRRLDGMNKDEMAKTAESLLANSGWLPESLRTPGRPIPTVTALEPASDAGAPAAAADSPTAECVSTDADEAGRGYAPRGGSESPRESDADSSRSDG